jgi:6-phosphogluconolactonase (cycloisomerase 2 family)
MESNNLHVPNRGPLSAVSRRGLLKGAAAFLAAGYAPRLRAQSSGSVLVYIGAYTPNGQGIHILSMNPTDGSLKQIKIVTANSPSSIAFDPSNKFLFAVNEISNYNGNKDGSVTGYTVNRSTGDLTLVNVVSSGGASPAHVSVDASGKYVLASNYGGGTVSLIPFDPKTGMLSPPSDTKAFSGSLGTMYAVDRPYGSFANSGHEAHHAHMAATDPSGKWVIGTNLGNDQVYVWALDTAAGKLTPASVPTVAVSPGAGPRHFAFHPNGKWFYVINEEGSSMTFMAFDSLTGTLQPRQNLSTLPSGFTGTNYNSEVGLSPDGRFLYGANRLHDTIAVFSIDTTGNLTLLGETVLGGDYPRSFGIDPSGNYMYVLNQRSDNIGILKVNKSTGMLTHTGQFAGVGSPSGIAFLTLSS